jgi:hypothetical protein
MKKGALKKKFRKAAMSTGKSIQKGVAKAKAGAKKLGKAVKRDAVNVGKVYVKGGKKIGRVSKLAGKAAGMSKVGKKVKSAIQAVKNA